MRREFFVYLYELMKKDPNIWVITADLGYGGFNNIIQDSETLSRYINVGASEQLMLSIACGLAREGKKVFCYSITPFLLYRPFEVIRTYIDHESIPVCLVGSGRDKDYAHDGFSHDASDDKKFMKQFKNIQSEWPTSVEDMKLSVDEYLSSALPYYINLKR